MAKKTARILISLVCSKCGRQNYITSKNKQTTKKKLVLRKYCKRCRRHTEHRERRKLK